MGTLSPPPSAFQAATGEQSVPGQRPAVAGARMGALEEPVLPPRSQRLGARAVLPPSRGGQRGLQGELAEGGLGATRSSRARGQQHGQRCSLRSTKPGGRTPTARGRSWSTWRGAGQPEAPWTKAQATRFSF